MVSSLSCYQFLALHAIHANHNSLFGLTMTHAASKRSTPTKAQPSSSQPLGVRSSWSSTGCRRWCLGQTSASRGCCGPKRIMHGHATHLGSSSPLTGALLSTRGTVSGCNGLCIVQDNGDSIAKKPLNHGTLHPVFLQHTSRSVRFRSKSPTKSLEC